MNSERPSRSSGVIEPAGKPLTIDDIRKAEVASDVRHGLISLEEACDHYKLSVDEVLAWVRVLEVHGVPGLRTSVELPVGGPARQRNAAGRSHRGDMLGGRDL